MGYSTEAEALTVKCPKCGADAGVWCVYVMPPETDAYGFSTLHRPSVRAQVQRAGTRTKVLHYDRRRRYFELDRKRRLAVPVDPAAAGQLAAARAMREWDRREYVRLVDWLRNHGDVLFQGK